MKNVLITGASGMIGGLVLRACLERPDVARVTAVVRQPLGVQHPKLTEVLLADVGDPAPIAAALQGQDVCFYCIGVYTGAVPRDVFRRITVDDTLAFAKALRQGSPGATFCLLSGDGADRTEKSRLMFARDKGAQENGLVRLAFPHLHVFRPGYIYPVERRREPNLSYRIFRALYKPLISKFGAGASVTSVQLAQAMVRVGLEGGAQEIYENRDIRALA